MADEEIYTKDWVLVCKDAVKFSFKEFMANPCDRTEKSLLGAMATHKDAVIKYAEQGKTGTRRGWTDKPVKVRHRYD